MYYYNRYQYRLKAPMRQTAEEYVSGNMRFYFIKHAVVDKEEDSTPIIYEQKRQLVPDHSFDNSKLQSSQNKNDPALFSGSNLLQNQREIIYSTRTIGTQTLLRESEAQTHPAPLGKIKKDGTFQEINELKDLHFGNGLPADTHIIELIEKAREKRAFNDALPPLSDEASFNLRNRFTNDQENREWKQKEKEMEEINNKRLLTLQQYLENREKEFEKRRLEKIDKLKEKKDEEVEAFIIKSRKRRVKIIRNISKMKEKFQNNKGERKRDIILDYASFGSKVYAPLTRDGHNPDRHPFKFELNSYSLTTFDGLSELESEITSTANTTMSSITKPKMEKQYNNSLSKLEKVHMKAIEDAFGSIQKAEKKKIEEERIRKKKLEEEERLRIERNKPPEPIPEKNLILEDVLLFQRLLRGRKEQLLMQEGKKNRFELIRELKRADEWKNAGATDEEQKLIDNYKEKLTNGVVDAIEGDNIAKTLDYLSKEMIRIKEEQKINAIVMMAENERRKREAEEMGRRQAENILRNRQDIMARELQEVNQATMDSYINSLFTNTVNKVSKKQVIKEIEIKANKLNKIVDSIENKFVKDDVRIRDLVSSFIIPEIERKKKQDTLELEEKRFIERAKVAINTSLKNAQKEYNKEEDEEDEKEINNEEDKKVEDEHKKKIVGFVGDEENKPEPHFNIEGDVKKIRRDVNEIGTSMKDDLPKEDESKEQELKLGDEEGEHHDVIEEHHDELNASNEENNVIQEHHEEYHEEHHEEHHEENVIEEHHEEHHEENVIEEHKEENNLPTEVNEENPEEQHNENVNEEQQNENVNEEQQNENPPEEQNVNEEQQNENPPEEEQQNENPPEEEHQNENVNENPPEEQQNENPPEEQQNENPPEEQQNENVNEEQQNENPPEEQNVNEEQQNENPPEEEHYEENIEEQNNNIEEEPHNNEINIQEIEKKEEEDKKEENDEINRANVNIANDDLL